MKTEGTANETVERHLETLKTMRNAQARREYIDNVQRAEGKFVADWLKAKFTEWWGHK